MINLFLVLKYFIHLFFQNVGFLLTEQAHQSSLKTVGGRVLILWLLCCINITTLYKAQLSSFITKPSTDLLLNFDELVKDGYGLNLVKVSMWLPV